MRGEADTEDYFFLCQLPPGCALESQSQKGSAENCHWSEAVDGVQYDLHGTNRSADKVV